MGVYSDIQEDMKEAMDDDLSDAVTTLTITESASSITYDPITGFPSSTPVVNTMRCIIIDADLQDEQEPYSDTSKNSIEVMVLDSEKTVSFRTGLKASVKNTDYEILQYKIDPVGATHNLELRGL